MPKIQLVIGGLTILMATQTVQAAELQQVHAAIPAAARQLVPTGPVSSTNRLSLAVALPVRNQAALDNLLHDLYDPASPRYHHFLSAAEFTEQFGPSQTDYDAVAAFAERNGLRVAGRHANRMLLDVEGSVADVEKTLHVQMRNFAHPTEARVFHAADREPTLDLSVRVLGISGLDNYALPKPRVQVRPLGSANSPLPKAGSGPSGTYMGQDFRNAYAPGSVVDGTGQTVGLLQFDGYTPGDITHYENMAGLPHVPVVDVFVDGFTGGPSGFGGEVEVSLDIEMAISMAPGLSKVIVYQAGPFGNWHDILNRMASDNQAKQLSCSWYSPGDGADPIADQIWEEMAAQGQSFFNASGDYNAYSGPIDFPGDTPYITQVGGTMLTMTGSGAAYGMEAVWNRGDGIGSGGGVSTQYTIPAWQAPVSMAANYGSTTHRNTPDVAMVAEDVYVRADGEDLGVGGTSCAAPLWAGFAALINQQAVFYGQPVMGFFNPIVYGLGLGPRYTTAFHDITVGNNGSATHFPAVAGYDLATGWGTPQGQPLIDAIIPPDTLIISPPTGFASSGAVGGAFDISAENLVLTNASTSNLTWAVSNNAAWLTVWPANGSLGGGGQSNLTVSLNDTASNLPPGAYVGKVFITNETTAFVHQLSFTLSIHDPLVISPAGGFASVGPTGGPFTPPLQTYALSNSGLGSLSWSLSNSATWLDTSAPGGELDPGASTNVTVALNTVASNLPAAYFSGDILFSNLSGALTQDFAFSLRTGEVPVNNNGFELGNFSGWTLSGNTVGDLVSSNPPDVHSGNYAAALGSAGSLGHLSQTLSTQPGQVYLISFWLQNQGFGTANEFQVNWEGSTVIDQFNAGSFGWTNIQIVVAAVSSNSVLDFGSRNDGYYFGLDDVSVFETTDFAPAPPVITSQPGDQNLNAGWTATFSAGVSGIQPFYYQWQSGGSNLAGATNAMLVLSPVTPAEAGTYSLLVSNAFGATNTAGAMLTVNVPDCDAPAPGLISWWAGESDANDSFGSNNGVLTDGVTFSPGEVNQAFDFDGISKHVEVPSSPDFNFPGSFTLEGWIYPYTHSAGGIIMGKWSDLGDYLNTRSYNVSLNPDNSLLFAIADAAHQWDVGFQTFETAPGAIPLNAWTHVAAVYDQSTGTRHIYLNGVEVTNRTDEPITVLSAVTKFSIGARMTTSSQAVDFFAGRVDEVSLYDRALTPAQIWRIYAAGSSGKCQPTFAPTIVSQPSGETVISGSTVSFDVRARGSAPLSYQWLVNNSNILGSDNATATNGMLVLSNVQAALSGNFYSVIVSNNFGATNSTAALLTVIPPGSCFPPPTNIVSWWAAEGNANDSSGTNNGALKGGTGFAAGEVGAAFNFDGSSKYVEVPSSPQFNFPGSFTLEAWVNPQVAGGVVMGKWSDLGDYLDTRSYVVALTTNNELQFGISDAAHQWDTSFHQFNSPPNAVPLNTWTHIAAVYDQSTGTRSLYVNGVNIANRTDAPITVLSANTKFSIGARMTTSTQAIDFFGGDVDEASIYNRALSAGEIFGIYAAGGTGKCQPPSPPVVFSQPSDQTVLAGVTATFTVGASGTAPLNYQWLVNSATIPVSANPTATNATLVLSNVQVAMSGDVYSVIVSNSVGYTNSSNAVLTVVSPGSCFPPPSGIISWWPAEGNATDTAGTNNGAVKNGTGFVPGEVGQAFDFDGISKYVEVPSSPQFNFPGSFTLEAWIYPHGSGIIMGKWSDLGDYQDTRSYNVSLNQDNSLQFAIADAAHQWDGGFQIFNTSPNAVPPNTWTHVAAVYDQSTGTRRIYLNGLEVANRTDQPITVLSANTKFSIGARMTTGTQAIDFFAGRVDEVSLYGRALSPAEVYAIYNAGAAGKCGTPTAPVVTSQPTNETVLARGTATFGITASGSAPLTYQWLVNNAAVPASGNPTATNAMLVLTNVQAGASGNLYSVVVSNYVGVTTSSNALLTVITPVCYPAPSQIVSWWAGEGNANDSVGTNNGVYVNGPSYATGEVNQAFDFDGISKHVEVPSSPQFNFPGSFTLETWIYPYYHTSGGIIMGKWSDLGDYQDTRSYNISINSDNSLQFAIADAAHQWDGSFQVFNTSPNAVATNTWTHVAAVYDQSSGTRRIYVNGVNVANRTDAPITVLNANTKLSIGARMTTSTQALDFFAGRVDEVSIYNRALTATEVMGIYAAGSGGKCPPSSAPVIVAQPTNQAVLLGTTAAFGVGVTGTLPLNYQWLFNGGPISPLANPTATNATLVLSNVQAGSAGGYSVVVTNFVGGTNSSNALLTVLYPPAITMQPKGDLVQLGCTVAFTSGATGSGTLSYQWQKDGSNLVGQTATNLTILKVQPADFAGYAMEASSIYGAVTSSVAVLAPDHPPIPGGTIVQRYPNGGLRINVSDVLANASDPDGDPIALVSINPTSVAGGTVSLSGGSIRYSPPTGYTNADAFNYLLSDGHCGGTAFGTVLVNVRTDNNPAARVIISKPGDGSVQVLFDGMPFTDYRVQSTTNIDTPDWLDVGAMTADGYGSFTYTDWPATNGPERYFRAATP